MSIVIGIDVGTSATKAVLIDAQQNIVAQATHHTKTNFPADGQAEQSPDDWISGATAALLDLRQQNSAAFESCAAIGLSGQMHGAVLLNRAARPLRPAILWNDSRASAEAAEIQTEFPELAEEAGVLCMASFVVPKILWLRRHEPQILNGLAHLLLPKDYVRLWLTGEHATDMVDAAGAWLLDEAGRRWCKTILDKFELDERKLPHLLEGNAISGLLRKDIAISLGLRANIPVVAGCGDAAAGGIGLGAIEDNEAFISLGTSCQLFVTKVKYEPRIAAAVHTYAHGLPNRWFQMAALLNGASTLSWWAGITSKEPSMLLSEMERSETSYSNVYFMPYLSGERTPHNNPDLRGSFVNLAASTSRAELTKTVLEGVAFSLADARDAIELHRSETTSLGLIGGGAQSDAWAQIISDVLNLTVVRYNGSRVGPAFGAARLARVAIEDRALTEICFKPKVDQIFEPRPGMRGYFDEKLSNWRGYAAAYASV